MAPTKAATFDSHNPATNEVIASHEIYSEEAVKAAVERARDASREWRE
jgi:acyl-CoA reductase-like NAD-dependent aldehyde dehydrogenase